MKKLLFVCALLCLPLWSLAAQEEYAASLLKKFTGEVLADRAGISVSSAGDVNNDGFEDVLVGASSNSDAGAFAGAAYLIYGQAAQLTSASLSTAVEFTGEAAGDNAGISVSSAGDVNGDGYDDILIGASGNDDGGDSAGATYLIYGQAASLTSASLSTAVEFSGEAATDLSGDSISLAGDVNGDGYDDILIGAYNNDNGGSNAGAAYLIYGQAAQLTSVSLSTAVEFTGEAAGDYAGDSVSSAGDVNNDGYDDIITGAYGNDDGGSVAGATYLIYGQQAALASVSLSTIIEFTGEAAGDISGFSVSSAGDVNNDGYDDIITGAYGNDDGGSMAGAAFLVYGQTT
ncbi:MAG: integrin alpha, partial [Patescibacteria group bacterium]